ncbi:MAG: hypothetical protein H7839_10570 [Magnetococcus sp. YQC-5]
MMGSIARFEESPWGATGRSDPVVASQGGSQDESHEQKGLLQEIPSDRAWGAWNTRSDQEILFLDHQADAVAKDVWQALQDAVDEDQPIQEYESERDTVESLPPFWSLLHPGRLNAWERPVGEGGLIPVEEGASDHSVSSERSERSEELTDFVGMWQRSLQTDPSVRTPVNKESVSRHDTRVASAAITEQEQSEPSISSESPGTLAELVRCALEGIEPSSSQEQSSSVPDSPRELFRVEQALKPEPELQQPLRLEQALKPEPDQHAVKAATLLQGYQGHERSQTATDFLIAAALISGVDERLTRPINRQVSPEPVQDPMPECEEMPESEEKPESEEMPESSLALPDSVIPEHVGHVWLDERVDVKAAEASAEITKEQIPMEPKQDQQDLQQDDHGNASSNLTDLLTQIMPFALKKVLPEALDEVLPQAMRRVMPQVRYAAASGLATESARGMSVEERRFSLKEQQQMRRPWTEIWLEKSASAQTGRDKKTALKGVRFQQLRVMVKDASLVSPVLPDFPPVDAIPVVSDLSVLNTVSSGMVESLPEPVELASLDKIPVDSPGVVESPAEPVELAPVEQTVPDVESAPEPVKLAPVEQTAPDVEPVPEPVELAPVDQTAPVVEPAPEPVELAQVEQISAEVEVSQESVGAAQEEEEESYEFQPIDIYEVLWVDPQANLENSVPDDGATESIKPPSDAKSEWVPVESLGSGIKSEWVPVESLGSGILHLLGDAAGGIVTVTGLLAPKPPQRDVAPVFFDRMGGKVSQGFGTLVSGMGGILFGGVGIALGTVGCLVGALETVGQSMVGGRSVDKKVQ